MKNYTKPFIESIPTPARNMAGKGAPASTVFGVIGKTMMDSYSRSLGGLVKETRTDVPMKAGTVISDTKSMDTERGIVGPRSKTPMPGAHYGQVPYVGQYMSKVGASM
jgi:hypothetical protein